MNPIYDTLNKKQQEAVFCTEGPLLILAGAGSGKTRVLIHRIAYLIQEHQVSPWNIMAITFTNKAAKEMRERVDHIIGREGEQVWVATFHSSCVRILRRFIDRIGFDISFTIYDTEDQKSLMKKIFKELQINSEYYKEKSVLHYISDCKNQLIDCEEAMKQARDVYEQKLASLYIEYQKALKKNNALDFDDLIGKTVELFERDKEVLEYYQEKFRYIMVDEYQDTNYAQFCFIELLSQKYRNICVVGDDDQSIYGFRGADIQNILDFEKVFSGTRVIKLEQNYRSVGNILEVANSIIRNNIYRKNKALWTEKEKGRKVLLNQYNSGKDEAVGVIRDIIKEVGTESNYYDFAILYRTNAQSRLLEEQCVLYGIPYQIVGGINFYQRKEIKDILAYLKLIANPSDDIALLRILNVPRRGIGQISIQRIQAYALKNNVSLYRACENAINIKSLGKIASKVQEFADLIYKYKILAYQQECSPKDVIQGILEDIAYIDTLYEEDKLDAQERIQNINELIAKAKEYNTMDLFLEEVSLIADIDRMDENASRVLLMTLHTAKGLEFPYVYLVGLEDGLFPSNMSMDTEQGLEEERRLCYVGITRAEQKLTMSYAKYRFVNGENRYNKPSRFLKEIPLSMLSGNIENLNRKYQGEYEDKGYESKGYDKYISYSNVESYKKKSIPLSSFKTNFGKEFKIEKADSLDYTVGDRVKHMKFGMGIVTEIIEGKKDFEVSVDFDNIGKKKMMSTFAKLEKV